VLDIRSGLLPRRYRIPEPVDYSREDLQHGCGLMRSGRLRFGSRLCLCARSRLPPPCSFPAVGISCPPFVIELATGVCAQRPSRVPRGFHAECSALLETSRVLVQRTTGPCPCRLAAVPHTSGGGAGGHVARAWIRRTIVHGFRVTHRGDRPPLPPAAPNARRSWAASAIGRARLGPELPADALLRDPSRAAPARFTRSLSVIR